MGCGGSKDEGASSPSRTQQGGGRTGKVNPEQVVVQVNGHRSPVKSVSQSPRKGQGSVQNSPYGSPQKSTGSPQRSTSNSKQATAPQRQSGRQPVVGRSGATAARGANQSGGYGGGGSGDHTRRSQRGQAYSSRDEEEEVVRSEPHDKGYKRRVREKLRAATAGKDLEELERAIDVFNKSRMEDCGDLSDAMKKLKYLRLKRDLRDAMRRRHVGVLDKTIEEARNSQHADRLQPQIEAAERMRAHLLELNRYKHDILQMEQSTISEVHSYQRPPACVHDVMAATYMLLGYDESRLTDWADIQGLMGRLGRDKLLKQVEEFDTQQVEPETASRVKAILDYHELDEVRDASNGAARFYVWSSSMVEKCERDSKNEEERQQQEEQKQQQQQQGARKRQG